MNYQLNKARARTRTTVPTQTDQSQAKDTDINKIVGQFLKTGTASAPAGEPMYGDFTGLPSSLREMIHTSRRLDEHRSRLPKELRDIPTHELLTMTPDAIRDRLQPPAPTPAPTGDEPKDKT